MFQIDGLGLDGRIELSVSIIFTVSHLLGSSLGKVMVRVRQQLTNPNETITRHTNPPIQIISRGIPFTICLLTGRHAVLDPFAIDLSIK